MNILADPRETPSTGFEDLVLSPGQIEELILRDPATRNATSTLQPDTLAVCQKLFRQAGLAALSAHCENDGWVQFSMTPAAGALQKLYGAMRDLLARCGDDCALKNGFFMHKPPGVRLRLQTALAATDALEGHIAKALQDWQAQGLITSQRRDIYEPETTLFGGKASMDFVHDLFSGDTEFWLEFHAKGADRTRIMEVCLILLRYIFAGLEIEDWEDLDVWDKVRSKTGRAFPAGLDLADDTVKAASDPVAWVWIEPGWALAQLDPDLAKRTEIAGEALYTLARRWKTQCFDVGAASIGIRAAAALYTIFLFNRAGLSLERQVILAETLATRKVLD